MPVQILSVACQVQLLETNADGEVVQIHETQALKHTGYKAFKLWADSLPAEIDGMLLARTIPLADPANADPK